MATEMIDNKHFETEAIQKRSVEVVHTWNELKEVAKARQEVCCIQRKKTLYLVCVLLWCVMNAIFKIRM